MEGYPLSAWVNRANVVDVAGLPSYRVSESPAARSRATTVMYTSGKRMVLVLPLDEVPTVTTSTGVITQSQLSFGT